MELARVPEYYSEELSMQHVSAEQYLQLVQRAAAHMQWFVVALNGDTIMCQTPATGFSQSEIITIVIQGKRALLTSRSADGYYWNEEQSKRNVDLFKHVLSQFIAAYDKADRNLHPMHRERFGALLPSKSYLTTPLIVYANVLVFIAMVIAGLSPLHPTAQSLFAWGGNFRQAVVGGEWWRLITYMFLHGGAMHLLGNTFALLYIGMFLEPLMGKFRFASAYIVTGVCAGLMSIAIHPFSVGVGASGAIFGMYGIFLSMLTTNHIKKTLRKTMLRSILFFVVFNLMMGLQGNTDNAAHIGGLIAGIILGYIYYPGISSHAPLRRQLITTAMIVGGVIVLTAATLHYL